MAETNDNCKEANEKLDLLHHQLQLDSKEFIFPLIPFCLYLPNKEASYAISVKVRRGFREDEMKVDILS